MLARNRLASRGGKARADEFRGEAAEYDRTGEFPAANYARIRG